MKEFLNFDNWNNLHITPKNDENLLITLQYLPGVMSYFFNYTLNPALITWHKVMPNHTQSFNTWGGLKYYKIRCHPR